MAWHGPLSAINVVNTYLAGSCSQLLRVSVLLQKPWLEIAEPLGSLGFEAGWGANVGLVKESMHELLEILQAPDDKTVESFLGRLPMINDVIPV